MSSRASAFPPLVAIVGPTAAGKSGLALAVAARHGGEIVSCDSLQVYRGLDIGSAKATADERRAVRHHMLDIVDPMASFSAADYANAAREVIGAIRDRQRLPVVVGGTGLYLRALLQGLFDGPARDEAIRARLDAMGDRFGNPRLHRMLNTVDAAAASRIEPNDRLRIVRALEVYFKTGRPMSHEQARGSTPLRGFRVGVFGVDPGREALTAAIERRTRTMFEAGLMDEVRRLQAAGHGPGLRPLRAIGYRQAFAALAGEMDEAQAERAIVVETLRYAKRQRTWFRHQVDARWFTDTQSALHAVSDWLIGDP